MQELKTKTVQEQSKLLQETREAVRRLRFEISGHAGKKNLRALRDAKKFIAQLLTLQNADKRAKAKS
ncbi:MAG: 50S ribosomal protein L29 [Parcubacteria group bacterium CG_4_10_14_0_8_um_filter_48_154]|nr:MAG: 50S ribosomal protein L29 [Parcubacteria group bacterium CG_4_10_14_0_8_um_filter_48_154]